MASPLLCLILGAAATCAFADSSDGVLAPRAALIRSDKTYVDAASDSEAGTERLGASEVVIAGDGSWAAARHTRQSSSSNRSRAASLAERSQVHSRSRVHSWASATVRAMGFADTCQNLFWAGWITVDNCRDKNMPEYEFPSCRCMRQGTAWPAKYCTSQTLPKIGEAVKSDSSFAAADIKDAVNMAEHRKLAQLIKDKDTSGEGTGSGLLELESSQSPSTESSSNSRGTVSGQAVDKIDTDEFVNEVYGGCEACCERQYFFFWGLLLIPLVICCCCGCCLAHNQRVHAQNAELRKKLEEISESVNFRPQVPSMPQMTGYGAAPAQPTDAPEQPAS